jgi:uncharacterized protein
MSNTGLNAMKNSFLDIMNKRSLQARAIFDGLDLPRDCEVCPEKETCAGGHLPHRYAHRNGFDNRSVWCSDLLALYTHIRERLGVSVQETVQRREQLSRELLRLAVD